MDRKEIALKIERLVRKQKYKQLLEQGAELSLRAETADPVETFEAVTKIMEQSNALQNQGRCKDRAENATEVLMDAQVLKMSHDVVHAAMQRMGNSEFADDELVGVILTTFDSDEGVQDWDKITREAASVFRMTKHSQSLYGAFDAEATPVQKVARQRAQRQRVDYGQAKKPETVDKLQKKEKTAQKLNVIFAQINELFEKRRGAPIPYFELICDPEDFMNTVDNAFQISFLIRDGRVALVVDENHDPLIRPTTQREADQGKQKSDTTQAILGLNPRKWREIVERYQVDEPMLVLDRAEHSILSQSQRN
ncbi:DNA repair protein Rad62 [Culex quinquefasciatus]|uniref:Non-structural maintenance of chromosomes element 4 n=1 Tax=Culex quinquefasciatus TaxID=7176 RepID=B0WSU2_CULQU|nr:EP300-interacting inhibitor of differentiation 3 [Culex quinquefasciatus]EDS34052.1 DNA repair protein Rad62 [Culex quinquefasciatus]|eukprot:XP_001870711.1 DNA repair protein Rad62 [Culex quinquefasciatus]